jgi:hypothetical protein
MALPLVAAAGNNSNSKSFLLLPKVAKTQLVQSLILSVFQYCYPA